MRQLCESKTSGEQRELWEPQFGPDDISRVCGAMGSRKLPSRVDGKQRKEAQNGFQGLQPEASSRGQVAMTIGMKVYRF